MYVVLNTAVCKYISFKLLLCQQVGQNLRTFFQLHDFRCATVASETKETALTVLFHISFVPNTYALTFPTVFELAISPDMTA